MNENSSSNSSSSRLNIFINFKLALINKKNNNKIFKIIKMISKYFKYFKLK
jgi:hypothetical protein